VAKLDRITLRGFKSFESLEDFELRDLNVLIGANGSGKSNFVEFFRLIRAIAKGRLQLYARTNGPVEGLYFNGPGRTSEIRAVLQFTTLQHSFTLTPTTDGGLWLVEQVIAAHPDGTVTKTDGGSESRLTVDAIGPGRHAATDAVQSLALLLDGCRVYHFHNTGAFAGMRRDGGVLQTDRLDPGAENLAAYLLGLREQHPGIFRLIRETTQRIAPFFDDFDLRITAGKHEDQVRLTWRQKGTDYIFSPGHLSDGTIRFICLVTALLQPTAPRLVVLDEPELGLHPDALAVLGGLIRSASRRVQVIVATQSPLLLNEFSTEDIVTVDRVDGASRLSRLDTDALDAWLARYTLADLWQKGTISGGVGHA